MRVYTQAVAERECVKGDPEIKVYELKERAAGAVSLPLRAISHEDSDNPYAPPRFDVGTLSVAGEADALRRTLAPVEAFAKAVCIVCTIFAILDVYVVMGHAGWAIVAKLGVISTPWPFHRSAAIISIALGVPVAITGFTAGHGLRHLRSWSSWTLAAFSLALFLQFVVLAYDDLQRAAPKVALMTLALGALGLTPVVALWRFDLSSILSKDYGRAVAETPHVQVRAKLPLAVKCTMALILVVFIGLVWGEVMGHL